METRKCSICGAERPLNKFAKTKCGHLSFCYHCLYLKRKQKSWDRGMSHPYYESKDSAVYLGVHIAERALSGFFDNIIKMPYGNPGYDFICGKGFKIDVKSSCLNAPSKNRVSGKWVFAIKYNDVPDYFLCLAFDDRDNLNPLHVWLIEGNLINHTLTFTIGNTSRSLSKWSKHERPLDRVVAGCAAIRNSSAARS